MLQGTNTHIPTTCIRETREKSIIFKKWRLEEGISSEFTGRVWSCQIGWINFDPIFPYFFWDGLSADPGKIDNPPTIFGSNLCMASWIYHPEDAESISSKNGTFVEFLLQKNYPGLTGLTFGWESLLNYSWYHTGFLTRNHLNKDSSPFRCVFRDRFPYHELKAPCTLLPSLTWPSSSFVSSTSCGFVKFSETKNPEAELDHNKLGRTFPLVFTDDLEGFSTTRGRLRLRWNWPRWMYTHEN